MHFVAGNVISDCIIEHVARTKTTVKLRQIVEDNSVKEAVNRRLAQLYKKYHGTGLKLRVRATRFCRGHVGPYQVTTYGRCHLCGKSVVVRHEKLGIHWVVRGKEKCPGTNCPAQ